MSRNYKIKPHRNKVNNPNNRLRLSVFKSNKAFYVQVIDDQKGETLASASSLKEKNGANRDAAAAVGKQIAKIIKEKKLGEVVLHRSSGRYTGRIQAFAEAARESGVKF